MNEYETYNHNGLTVKIYYDDISENPRDWDNLGTMALTHKRYDLGDTQNLLDFDDFTGWHEVENFLDEQQAVYLPVYMYDHSGLAFSVHDFNDRWDSGQVGYIYALPETIRREYNVKRISKQLRQQVERTLLSEVETYNQYHSGDVYGYEVLDSDGDVLDSCWGFYGIEHVKTDANDMADWHAKQPRTNHKPRNARELHA